MKSEELKDFIRLMFVILFVLGWVAVLLASFLQVINIK